MTIKKNVWEKRKRRECVGGSWKLRPRFSSTIKEKDEFSYKEINYILIKVVEIYTQGLCACDMRMCKNLWGKKADEYVCSDKD